MLNYQRVSSWFLSVVSILGAIVVPGLVASPVHMTPGAPLEFSFREPVRAIDGKSGNWQLENEL